jgi:hypothetical protein
MDGIAVEWLESPTLVAMNHHRGAREQEIDSPMGSDGGSYEARRQT